MTSSKLYETGHDQRTPRRKTKANVFEPYYASGYAYEKAWG